MTRRLARALGLRLALASAAAAGVAFVFRAYLAPDHLLDWLATSSLCG